MSLSSLEVDVFEPKLTRRFRSLSPGCRRKENPRRGPSSCVSLVVHLLANLRSKRPPPSSSIFSRRWPLPPRRSLSSIAVHLSVAVHLPPLPFTFLHCRSSSCCCSPSFIAVHRPPVAGVCYRTRPATHSSLICRSSSPTVVHHPFVAGVCYRTRPATNSSHIHRSSSSPQMGHPSERALPFPPLSPVHLT